MDQGLIWHVTEIRCGRLAPLGPVKSGIDKQPIVTPVAVGVQGLVGDAHGDTRHHGGPDKALHAYAAAHYADWRRELPDTPHLRPGGFGENLVVTGATEADLCIGDLWQLGQAVLQVSQSRQPCGRLNLRFQRPDMALRVQATGRSGWYFRVLTPGLIAPGPARLMARPHADWSLSRVNHLLYHDPLNRDALASFAALPDLPPSWQALVRDRLTTGRTEDWTRRIATPA